MNFPQKCVKVAHGGIVATIIIFPTIWGKSVFPILETLYHGFTELRNRHNGANIQLNIELIRESCSGLSFERSLVNERYLLTY